MFIYYISIERKREIPLGSFALKDGGNTFFKILIALLIRENNLSSQLFILRGNSA